jgi:hypothetical protein
MLDRIDGWLRHRLLVSWSADPEIVAGLLPEPFRPQVVDGRAVVGVCLLRLEHLRPPHLPARLGVASDNAAHRVAAEWTGVDGDRHRGVYILRRDAAQLLPVALGGRLFPGVHGRARFAVRDEPGGGLSIGFRTASGLDVQAAARPAAAWSSCLFDSPDAASAFYERGSCGWSAGRRQRQEGVELGSGRWSAIPVEVEATTSLFDDPLRFPPGSIEPDRGGLLLRDLPVTWRRVPIAVSRSGVWGGAPRRGGRSSGGCCGAPRPSA